MRAARRPCASAILVVQPMPSFAEFAAHPALACAGLLAASNQLM